MHILPIVVAVFHSIWNIHLSHILSLCLPPPILITHDRPIIRQRWRRWWWWSHLLRESITKSMCLSWRKHLAPAGGAITATLQFNTSTATHAEIDSRVLWEVLATVCRAPISLLQQVTRMSPGLLLLERMRWENGQVANNTLLIHSRYTCHDRPEALQHAGV